MTVFAHWEPEFIHSSGSIEIPYLGSNCPSLLRRAFPMLDPPLHEAFPFNLTQKFALGRHGDNLARFDHRLPLLILSFSSHCHVAGLTGYCGDNCVSLRPQGAQQGLEQGLENGRQSHRSASLVVMISIFILLRVLISQRPTYQKLARVVRPIAAVAMRGPSQMASPSEMTPVNEKQEAWLEQSYHWWRLYRSLTRAYGLLCRVYSWNAVAS